MRERLRGATFVGVAVAVAGIVMFGGCSRRSAAQKAYLVGQSSGLGRCAVGGGGDGPPPFDPMSAESWNRLNRLNVKGAWARVLTWQITSKPKDPPQDFTVEVNARFDVLRGNRSVMRPTLGAYQQDAKSIARALEAELDVFVGVHPRREGDPYVGPALALDKNGRFAWLGECASRSSDSTAAAWKRAGVDPKAVAPAIRRWIADGDADALVHTLGQG